MVKKLYAHNEEEMLQKLKDEIIRLGLEKTPSRILISKIFNRDNMPHPTTYTNYFGPWESIMKRIGLENTRLGAAKEKEYKAPKVRWEDHSVEYWLEKLIDELCRVGLNENPSRTELIKVYDKNNILSPTTYQIKMGSWENVLKRIETDPRIKRKRNGNSYPKNRVASISPEKSQKVKNKQETLSYNDYFPNGPSQPVLINAMIDEMRAKKLYSRNEYEAKYNPNFLPSMYKFQKATGLSWKDLWEIYAERLGDPIKQEREKYKSDLNLFLLD